MAQRASRISCPRCGANNFDTVTACWKCGTALGGGTAAPTPPASAATSTLPPAYPVERAASLPPQPAAFAPSAPASAPTGDSGVAKRAAFALGITIPWIGLPVGWIFMMIEDRRKQTIGRICALWSMIGLVLHLLLFYFMVQQSVPFMLRLLVPVVDATARSRGAGGGEPSLPNGLPNVPPGGMNP